jgi:uncharacterized protein YbaP (TraB family)
MIWEVEKAGKRSYLVGSAHFFPYHFRTSLRRYIARVDTVLFEGPLDAESAKRVVEAGSTGSGQGSLIEALGAETIRKIQKELGGASPGLSSHLMFRSLLGLGRDALAWDDLKGVKPWLAFFQIWSVFLRRNGWRHKMELDALQIATVSGKTVHSLETIEEQIEALDDVPLERFVHFLRQVNWQDSRRGHLRHYLRGDLDGLMAKVKEYPTYCESIIQRRDPIFFARMRGFFEQGRVIAFLGTSHCRGIRARLVGDGYSVRAPAELS